MAYIPFKEVTITVFHVKPMFKLKVNMFSLLIIMCLNASGKKSDFKNSLK